MLLVCQAGDLLRNLKHCFRVLLGDGAKHIDSVDPNVDPLVAKTNQGVVEEHIEPLLVELGLLLQKVSLAAVDKLVFTQVFFQVLDDSNAQLHVVGGVRVNELAKLLAFVGALLDQGAVRPEKMLFKEIVELSGA